MGLLKVCLFMGILAIAACRDEIKKASRFTSLPDSWTAIKEKFAQYHLIEKGLEDDVIAQLELFQQWLVEGNPDLGIPVMDPWDVPHIEYATSNEDVTINLAIDGLHLTGLASFTIPELDINLLQLKAGGTLNIQELHFWADHYNLDGLLLSLLPLFGEGQIDVTIHNLNLTGSAALTTLNDQVGLKDVEVGVAFDAITGTIENILGSDMDDVINDILNILGGEIFASVSDLIGGDVALAIQNLVNDQLLGMTLQDLIDLITGNGRLAGLTHETEEVKEEAKEVKAGNADDYLDAILENVRAYLVSNGWDNYTLPDQIEGFSEEWAGITWHGEAQLTDGFLSGLQTIHRAGDAELSVNGDDGTITLVGNIEFFDFAAGYAMYVGFMDIGIDAQAAVTITSVQVGLVARLIVDPANEKAFTVVIDELNINNPGLVSVEFHGLGALDFLLDGLGFIVGNVFGGLIFDAIEGPIQEAIVNALGESIEPNAYLDDILTSVGQLMLANGWNTFPLPDQLEIFSVEILGINWHAEATMTNGFLSGLETIHRTQDVIISIDKDTDAIKIDAGLEFFDFTAGYDLYIGVMGLGIDAAAKAIISEVQVHLEASIFITNSTTNGTDATNSTSSDFMRGADIYIDDLQISNEFFIAVDFDGLGLFNFLLDAMGLLLVNVFSGLIFNMIEGPVTQALQDTLDEVIPYKLMAQIHTAALKQTVRLG